MRLKDRSGAYRVVYAIVTAGSIYVIHGFQKTTRTTPKRNIEIARKRMMEVRR
jgi:phage-related protein